MTLKMTYFGNPILRKKAAPIDEITDEIKDIAAEMVEVMRAQKGIGLAAPQVGLGIRLFIICVDHEDEEGEVVLGEPRVFINPILKNGSQEQVERSEGCLSIPELRAPVMRPLTIDVEALDLEGNRFEIKGAYGFLARVIMHENDHLNGVLFIDRIKGKQRAQLEPFLRKIKKEYKDK